MRVTIYLNAIEANNKAHELKEIRAASTHSLLALFGDSGIFLYDRRIRQQHALEWNQLVEILQSQFTLDELTHMYQSVQKKQAV
jgi:hypothetical protein